MMLRIACDAGSAQALRAPEKISFFGTSFGMAWCVSAGFVVWPAGFQPRLILAYIDALWRPEMTLECLG